MTTPNLIYVIDGDVIRGPFKSWDEANRAMYERAGPWTRAELAEMGNKTLEINTRGYDPEPPEGV